MLYSLNNNLLLSLECQAKHMDTCGDANSRMGGQVTTPPKACDGQVPGTTALSTDKLMEVACFISFILSFIHS